MDFSADFTNAGDLPKDPCVLRGTADDLRSRAESGAEDLEDSTDLHTAARGLIAFALILQGHSDMFNKNEVENAVSALQRLKRNGVIGEDPNTQ